MEAELRKIADELQISPHGALVQKVFKAGFNAGIEHAEQKFDEEQQELARAVLALEQ